MLMECRNITTNRPNLIPKVVSTLENECYTAEKLGREYVCLRYSRPRKLSKIASIRNIANILLTVIENTPDSNVKLALEIPKSTPYNTCVLLGELTEILRLTDWNNRIGIYLPYRVTKEVLQHIDTLEIHSYIYRD